MNKQSEIDWRICGKYQLRYVASTNWILRMTTNDMKYNKPVMLNEIGTFLWRLILNNVELQLIQEQLMQEYNVTEEEVNQECEAFFDLLEHFEIIHREVVEIL